MDVNKEKKDKAKTDVSETWNWAATSRNLGTSLAGRYTCPGAGAGAVAGAGAGAGRLEQMTLDLCGYILVKQSNDDERHPLVVTISSA